MNFNPSDGDLTYVGNIMANLPISIHLSKLILLGHAFGKLRETIILAAALSLKTFFTAYFKSYIEAFKGDFFFKVFHVLFNLIQFTF
jgi:ATP-dependent RNA helicase TDRD9